MESTGEDTRPQRATGREQDTDLWAHIEPDSSRQLLLSALRAFSARGFHAATTREIGEGAGMSTSAVYVHYRSKSDLLYEISRIGHRAVLAEVEAALEQAPDDPVERVRAFVSAFARWHAENHTLARVIQYELKSLPRRQFDQIATLRKRFEVLVQDELEAGVASGAFDVPDLEGTSLAVLSLCIDLARWYRPSPEHDPSRTGDLYARLVGRMVRGEGP